MADSISEILDDLDSVMLSDYESYMAQILGTWEGFSGNDGQMKIVREHLLPAATGHIRDAKERWPYGPGPDEYLQDLLSSFDQDVLLRAFGDTIQDSYDSVFDYWLEANDLQNEHDFVMAFIGGSSEPHSTHAVWR